MGFLSQELNTYGKWKKIALRVVNVLWSKQGASIFNKNKFKTVTGRNDHSRCIADVTKRYGSDMKLQPWHIFT